jgi:hypothetical protein
VGGAVSTMGRGCRAEVGWHIGDVPRVGSGVPPGPRVGVATPPAAWGPAYGG